jgi:hypothetical protein
MRFASHLTVNAHFPSRLMKRNSGSRRRIARLRCGDGWAWTWRSCLFKTAARVRRKGIMINLLDISMTRIVLHLFCTTSFQKAEVEPVFLLYCNHACTIHLFHLSLDGMLLVLNVNDFNIRTGANRGSPRCGAVIELARGRKVSRRERLIR